MPVDVDSLAIAAISGKIWNVVTPIELYNLANDGVERTIHHKARHIPFRNPQLFRPGTFCGHRLRHSALDLRPPSLCDTAPGAGHGYPSTALSRGPAQFVYIT